MTQLSEDSITVEEISSTKSFLALQDEWSVLEKSMSHPGVFLTHEWFSAAWRWRCLDSVLTILVVRHDGELIGACPLLRSAATQAFIKCTKLAYLAVPDSQECLILAKPSLESPVHQAIFAYLAARRDWDIAEIQQIPHESFTWKFLSSHAIQSAIAIGFRSDESNPTVSISGTWNDFYSRRSRRLKKGNNHIANKLKRQYSEISVECHHYSAWSDDLLRQACEDLITMSIRSWKSQETTSSFDHDGPKAWLSGISDLAARKGWLAVWILKVDGKCVATELQLIRNGIANALRADFDDTLRDLSPGAYLNWKILERIFAQDISGLTEYRMGPGPNLYKSRWSEHGLQLGHAVFYNKTNKARLIRLIEEWAKPKLRLAAKLLARQR